MFDSKLSGTLANCSTTAGLVGRAASPEYDVFVLAFFPPVYGVA
jgi:hypothetical protein